MAIFELKNLLVENNWTLLTVVNMLMLILFHFPCATTCLTIRKETGSTKWMFISMILPLLVGIILCIINKILFSL